jgi:hypothetical protein
LTETVDEVWLAWAGHGASICGMKLSRVLVSGQVSPVLAMRMMYDAKVLVQVILVDIQTPNRLIDFPIANALRNTTP